MIREDYNPRDESETTKLITKQNDKYPFCDNQLDQCG